MMGFAEQSITKPRKAWTPVPLERMDRDVEQEGVLHGQSAWRQSQGRAYGLADSLARSTEGSIHLAGDTEARPDKRSAQEEDEGQSASTHHDELMFTVLVESLLPRYGQ